MATVTLKGSTYTYTVTTPASLTITPSNINKYLSDVFTPVIKRNKSGEALTRYFEFSYSAFAFSKFKAVFTKAGTTATVSVVSHSYNADTRLGFLPNYNRKPTTITVTAGTDIDSMWTEVSAPISVSFSGFNPKAISVTGSLSQSSPSAGSFGYIKGFAKASWSANVTLDNLRWGYTDDAFGGTVYIDPSTTLTLSANGASASSGAGTTARSASLAAKVVNATSITATAKATNTLGGSTTKTATLTVQNYTNPVVSDAKLERNGGNATVSFKWTVAAINKSNTVQANCTTGTVLANWAIKDADGTVIDSGTETIVANGQTMNAVTGTCSFTSTETYSTEKSYTLTVSITDRIGATSAALSYTMPTEFCTMDVLAGGRGIAFGEVATEEGILIGKAMPLRLGLDVTTTGGRATAGTDKDLYNAIVDLGWQSEVIE